MRSVKVHFAKESMTHFWHINPYFMHSSPRSLTVMAWLSWMI